MSADGVTNLTSLELSGDLTVAGDEIITGDVTFAGNVNLGNASSDVVTITGKETVVSDNASALAVGPTGETAPVFKVDASTASVATGFSVTGAASGSGVTVAALGGTNEKIRVSGKGTGAVELGQATSTGVMLVADQPIVDSSSNEFIKFSKTASAVNEVTVTNAATAGSPSLTATGGDTDVSLIVGAKGAGTVLARSLVSVKQGAPAAATVSATLTAANLLTGIITVNQAGGAASAQQLPTASDLDTALPRFAADDAFDFSVINTSTVDAEDASVTTNTGWTLVGNMDIPAYSAAGSLNSSGTFRARKTGSAAWTLYRLS